MLDSIDYAANAGVVPAIACMGEKDVFFQAHVLMGEAMEKEGLKMVNLISPGTGHVDRPGDARGADAAHRRVSPTKGLDHCPEAPALRHLDAEVQPLPLAASAGPGRALRARGAGGRRCRRRHRRGEGAEERHALRDPAAGRSQERSRGCASAAREVALPPMRRDREQPRDRPARMGSGRISASSTPCSSTGKRPGLARADRRRLHDAVPVRPRHRQGRGTRRCRRGPTRA